jgi:hypothetical protein
VQDVTDTYLANAGFDLSCNYKVGDAATNLPSSDDGSTVLDIAGWNQHYEGWSAGATYEYGYAGTLNSPGSIPATGSDGSTTGNGHGTLGMCAAWTGTVTYYQNVTLPAGSYKLFYKAYNSGSAQYSKSMVGFVPDSGDSELSVLDGFSQNEWTSDEIYFTLNNEVSGTIQVGLASQNAGSGSHGRIFFDDLQLTYSQISDDASLADLTLSEGNLSPAFNRDITTYNVSLPQGTASVNISAVTNNEDAVVVGDGNILLDNGEGMATIEVTAANGNTTKTYTINFGVNCMYEWDGGGLTGTGSAPNNFGWECSPAIDAWTDANVFGVRFQDNVTYSYKGGSLTGRILYLRWDGTGGTTTSSVFSYPAVNLKACTAYLFEAKVAWNSNGSAPSYSVEINSARDNSGTSIVKEKVAVPVVGELHDIKLLFIPEEDGTYYFTIGSSSQVLGAIRDLSLSEYSGDPFIKVSSEELTYDSTRLSQSFHVSAFGLSENISFVAPRGMTLEPSEISPEDAQCGVTVTAGFENKEEVKNGQILVNSNELSEVIIVREVLPPFMMKGTYKLTTDGTWCWFQDPRAVYYEGEKKQTYTGWITSKGIVEVASYNHETGEVISNVISPPDFMQVDDHNNPTILVREDGRILVAYSGHFYGPMRVIVSTNPEDITSFGAESNFGNNVTYANPYQVGDSTVMFYRDGATWHPTINVSNDGGITWGQPAELITRNGNQQRPYVKYTQDSSGGIHMTFTTGHPRREPQNKIYYTYFKNSKFYRADGTLIKDFAVSGPLNIDAGEVETIYDASKCKGWTWDIALDSDENPVILFAAFPDDLNHHYYYATWNGSQWITNHIVNSGRWFPQTPEGANENEPNYSGGMVLDPNNPSVVYLSKQVNDVFEIYKYETNNKGASWTTTAITENTPADMINVRPVIPRGHKPGSFDVIWLRGKYVTYSNYLTSVMYYSSNTLNADLDSILVDGVRLSSFDASETSYILNLPPDTDNIPEVQGFSSLPLSQIEVTQADSLSGQAIIKVVSEGGVTTKTYVIDFIYESGSSTGSVMKDFFNVYPNPTNDELNIDLTQFNSVDSVSIVDLNGRLVKNFININEQLISFSIKEFEVGAYFVIVRGKDGSVSKKIIKK